MRELLVKIAICLGLYERDEMGQPTADAQAE